MLRTTCLVALLAIFSITALADDKAPVKKQTPLEAAYSKQRELSSQYRAEEKKVTQNTELMKLRKAWSDASAAVNKKIEALTVKERQAEKVAREALDAAIEKQIETSGEIAKLNEQRKSLEKKKRDLRYQIGLISVQLNHSDSPIQQSLDADTKLQALKKSSYTGTREERNTAFKKYYAARQEKLKTHTDAKKLYAKIEDLEKQIAQADKENYEAWKAINDVKRKIQYGEDNKSLQPLRDKLTAAKNATRKVPLDEQANKLREVAGKASNEYRKKYTELTSASKELTNLKAQLNTVYKQISDLRPKPTKAKDPKASNSKTPETKKGSETKPKPSNSKSPE